MRYVDLPGIDPDQVSLRMYPCGQNPLALVIWIHGGGWVSGDRRNVRRMPLFFEEHNILFASINYPLSSPSQSSLIDLQISALEGLNQWLTDDLQRDIYPNAFKNINILSHSAGSHLAALADKKFGWNPFVRSLILMDSGAYDLKKRFNRCRPAQKKMFSELLNLDHYPLSQHDSILQSYSPALLPPKKREGDPLDVVIISSQRPGARYAAEQLKKSYSGSGSSCKTYFWDWRHEDFPYSVGVDTDLSDLILNTVMSD